MTWVGGNPRGRHRTTFFFLPKEKRGKNVLRPQAVAIAVAPSPLPTRERHTDERGEDARPPRTSPHGRQRPRWSSSPRGRRGGGRTRRPPPARLRSSPCLGVPRITLQRLCKGQVWRRWTVVICFDKITYITPHS